MPIVYIFVHAITELYFIGDGKTRKQIKLYASLITLYLHLAFYLLTI